MTGRVLLRFLKKLGCQETRQSGSHVRVECGACMTTIPVHRGEELPKGTLGQIQRDLEPCLGERWLRRMR